MLIVFQPTLPLRGATSRTRRRGSYTNFNPRSPCGERLDRKVAPALRDAFQPTLPLRGATNSSGTIARVSVFQPTLPLRGATAIYSSSACVTVNISDIAQKQKSPSQATSGKTARQPVRTSRGIHESLPFAPPMAGASTPQPPTTQRTGLFGYQSTKKPSASYPGLAP